MIRELRYTDMLDGARGAPKVNREKLVELMLGVSRVAMAHPEIAEIDLNPVIAHDKGYTVVDVRMMFACQ